MKYRKNSIHDLFKKKNITYLSDYKVMYKNLLNINPKESEYYMDNIQEFKYLEKKYGNRIRERSFADIYIADAREKGLGLFSNSKIAKGGFIGVYLGVIDVITEMVEVDNSGFGTDYAWDYPDVLDGMPSLEVNAKYYGNELRFANHSEEPNLIVEHTIVDGLWYIFFVADRDICKDEELTISYGSDYWESEYRTLL